MDIEDAFTQDAILQAGVDVGGEEEIELRKMIKQLYVANEMDMNDNAEGVAVLCFIAGRAYQASFNLGSIKVAMGPELISEFLDFLVQRGEE